MGPVRDDIARERAMNVAVIQRVNERAAGLPQGENEKEGDGGQVEGRRNQERPLAESACLAWR